MALRQKVGQLFMVRPDALDLTLEQETIDDEKAGGVTYLSDAMRQTLEEYPVGGICQFGKNITDPQQITTFNASLQEASDVPLLIAVDEEGGSVARLANHPGFELPQYESADAVGATGNPEDARQMGCTIGSYLKSYGFTMDFAPVADVWTNPGNTVIGTRAFSQDASMAAAMADSMARGLREAGILPTFKHFPGHGNTAEDSHSGLAYTYRTKEEMAQCEFLPFLSSSGGDSEDGFRAVMVGHIAAPELGTGDTPASLSWQMVTKLLREELLENEDVLVITDSLAMGAITEQYTPGQAAVEAVLAGNDMILMPDGLAEAFEAVLAAVEDETISEERLDESVARILRFKQQYAGL
ncbi:MAG TPA: glycoside hydrolase family 3 protein [Candidatus Gemmiger excrementigallinarum]|uniref:beta-N-acetylhexosaminidase n=1 Tax=Candidatus Gemmiger excrementigallinarum TaxID=2838609 RepID=A0A9D2JAS5_9FIRM|nr:glycoside hydrolase family 3 protein [Candidatus Gemmiger excrementigallinarum]